jgi:glycosyltransferase involved in cell wall biosynthesis
MRRYGGNNADKAEKPPRSFGNTCAGFGETAKLYQRRTKMILTIGMIVKNEEENLEKCLEALKPLRESVSSELIVVDTGSTDKTVEIAERYDAKILHYEWTDDFAAARNVAVREAQGEWFMTIDADEVLVNSAAITQFLFGNPVRDNYALASYVQRNYKDDESYTDFNAVRLAKRTPELAYEGKIHEAFNVKGSLFMIPAHVEHWGYAESKNKGGERYRRNIELLKKQLEETPNDPLIMKQLYDSYVPTDRDEAVKWLDKCRTTAVSGGNDRLIIASFAKECVFYAVLDNGNKIINLFEEYKKLNLKLPKKNGHYALEMDIFAAAGLAYANAKRYAEAEKCFADYVLITDAYENGEMNTAELFVEEPTFPKSAANYVNILAKYRDTLISLQKTGEAEIIKKRITNPKWDGTIVSIGLIVKNEEKHLERCLIGLKPIREMVKSELIIVDTGSTDKTVEIAEKYGAKVLYFDWIGDFAAARNVGLRAAKGEWFMYIDADEHLINGEIIGNFFADTQFNQEFDSASYTIRNLDDNDVPCGDFRSFRIARNHKGLSFISKIHEHFNFVPQDNAVIEAFAEHRSYTAKVNKEQGNARFDRNITLLEEELEKNPDDLMKMKQLFDSYHPIDIKKADEWLDKCIEASYKQKESIMILSSVATRMVEFTAQKKYAQAVEVFGRFIKEDIKDIPKKYGHYTSEIDIYACAGLSYYNTGKYEETVKVLKEYVSMTDKYVSAEFTTLDTVAYVVTFDKNNSHYVNILVAYFRALAQLGRIKEAEKIYRRVKLTETPSWDETLLTIGMIVKNEEKDLEKCMQSIRHLRNVIKCQLIIVDTGSVDGTVEIAKKYADEVRHFTWINDFSAARNESMRGAKGDWFMFIDADEWFESTKEIEKFFRDGEYIQYNFGSYIQRNYSSDKSYTDFFAPRMCKMQPGQRFLKAVHESLVLTPPVKYFRDYVHHYGYVGESGQRKVLRNMDMLLSEHAQRPDDVIVIFQLTTAYSGRDNEKMLSLYREGIRLSQQKNEKAYELMFYAGLIRWHTLQKNYEKAYEIGNEIIEERYKAEGVSPSDIDIFAFYGLSCHRLDKFSDAEQAFNVYLQFYKAFKAGKLDSPMLMVDTPYSVQDDVYARILLDFADTLINLEKWEKAYAIATIPYNDDPHILGISSSSILSLKIVQRFLLMRNLNNYKTMPEFVRRFAADSMTDETRSYLIGALKNEINEAPDKKAYLKQLHEICREGFKFNLPHDFTALINLIWNEQNGTVSESTFIKATELVTEISDTGAELTQVVLRNNLKFDLISSKIDPEITDHLYVNLYAYRDRFEDNFAEYVANVPVAQHNARSKLILLKMAESSLMRFESGNPITEQNEIFLQCFVVLTDSYLKEVFEPEILTPENAEHLPEPIRAAFYLLLSYICFGDKDYKSCLSMLRGVIAAEPGFKNFVSALTQKVRFLI